MSATVHGPGDRPGLRRVLALVLAFDIYGVIYNLYIDPPPAVRLPWSPAWLLTLDDMVWPLVALAVLASIGVLGLARGGRAQLWFGLLTLVCMAVLVEAMSAHVGDHRRRFYTRGAVLLGWLVGLIFARARGAPHDRSERLAEAGAAAGLVAPYASAGLQKLFAGGLFQAHSLQGHIFTHHHIDDHSVIGAGARYVAHHPQLAVGVALSVVFVQLGSWVYLLSPRARMVWGTLLIGFHLGTQVFVHIIYLYSTVLLLAWSYPWARVLAAIRRRERGPTRVGRARSTGDAPVDRRELAIAAAMGALAVALAWVAPTPHELPRRDHAVKLPSAWHELRPAPRPAIDRLDRLDRLGPLAVGDALGPALIEAIELHGDEVLLNVTVGTTQFSLGFGGVGVPRGPHSDGGLNIYYRAADEIDFETIDPIGRALHDALVNGDDDPSQAMSLWIAQAQDLVSD